MASSNADSPDISEEEVQDRYGFSATTFVKRAALGEDSPADLPHFVGLADGVEDVGRPVAARRRGPWCIRPKATPRSGWDTRSSRCSRPTSRCPDGDAQGQAVER